MKTTQFMTHVKKTGATIAEVGVVTGGALLTTKFLDFNILFKDQIAKDPTFANKWYIKYQAPIKLVAGTFLASYVKNPWLKLAFIGIGVNGAIGTIRMATAKSDGTNFFNSVGQAEFDAKLLEAARTAGDKIAPQNTQVAIPFSKAYPTQVGKPVDLMVYPYSGVGNNGQGFRGVGVFMERGTGATGCAMNMN